MIKEFKDDYHFLSNFHMVDGVYLENLYQSAKATHESDRRWVLDSISPGLAKQRGRKVKCREDWEEIKIDIMRNLLREKFSNPIMKEKLLATGKQVLQEGNTWHDVFWGIDIHTGQGLNMLGKLLMQLRDELKENL